MAHRMTKEQLDEQFEQFLKESVSDDSVDLGGSGKHSVLDSVGKSPELSAKKRTVTKPWWQDEDYSEEGHGRAVSVEEPSRPIPKARSSKALERLSQAGKVRRATEEGPATPEGLRSPEVESNSGNPRSPVYETPRSASGVRGFDEHHSYDASLTGSDSDSQGSGDGLLKSGKTFRKSLRMSQPIQEEEEEEQHLGDKGLSEEEGPPIFSRDSLEPEDSLVLSGQGLKFAGMGALEEEEEKARFFAQLEDGSSSPRDHSRMNRELDDTTNISLGKAEQVVEGAMDGESESDRAPPASPHYSEDFEDEGSGKEVFEEKLVRPSMLSKVSLHDSLNSTGGAYFPNKDSKSREEPRKEDTARSLEADSALPVQSYGQSGASEFEALQEAYRQISHSAGEPEGQLPRHSSLERRERSPSPGVPTSPVDPSRGTLQRSTTESELPTAEELMKPIRPELDHTRGFALQPARSRETRRPTPPDSPEPRPWSIREEVHRLMHDGDSSSHDPVTPAGKAKKQQSPERSTMAGFSTSTLRKPTVASSRGKRPASRLSTVASRFSGAAGGRPGAAAKPPSPLSHRRPQSQPQPLPLQHSPKATPRPTETPQVVPGAEPGLRVSSELVASVQSFAAFLQHQIDIGPPGATMTLLDSRAPQETRKTPQPPDREVLAREEEEEEEEEESPLVGRLRLQLAQRERERHLREEHLVQLSALQQENYIMQSKLRSAEEAGASRKERWGLGEPSDPVTEERLELIEKEMKEQEVLIQGYQQENKKLYLQMKAQQAQNKLNEDAMFTENQRLLTELASTKERLNKSISPRETVGHHCPLDHTERITELLGQLHTVQRSEARLQEETRRLKQEMQALDVDLQLTKKERDLAKAQIVYSSGDKSYELRVQEEQHGEEVAALKKRLQWYAENQELLDRDAARLRTATGEIQKLTEQVEKLKSEVGK
ncbi:centrosomal protein of 162 kDa, partial [Aplochiton taeniatus]